MIVDVDCSMFIVCCLLCVVCGSLCVVCCWLVVSRVLSLFSCFFLTVVDLLFLAS